MHLNESVSRSLHDIYTRPFSTRAAKIAKDSTYTHQERYVLLVAIRQAVTNLMEILPQAIGHLNRSMSILQMSLGQIPKDSGSSSG